DEAPQVKRSSSPPRGAPKKRTAFIDITNVSSVRCFGEVYSTSVQSKNQANLKTTSSVSSEESTSERERTDVEEDDKKKEELQGDDSAPAEEAVHTSSPAPQELPAHFHMQPEKFVLSNYMHKQQSLNPEMRAILVDWLVEVQENFELFHETLYLAVKMTDHYLSEAPIHRQKLQLVGSTAMLIASKFEERCPPSVEDFLYICDDAYKKDELICMEACILQTLSFDINIPIPYRFLRRYARVRGLSVQ
ncbi:hypothetical protein XENOCAPTIV_005966, partial [Xenoophorus captivus]